MSESFVSCLMASTTSSVIARSREVLEELEKQTRGVESQTVDASQLSFFAAGTCAEPRSIPDELLELQGEIQRANINEMTPLQALTFVAKLQEKSRESTAKSS